MGAQIHRVTRSDVHGRRPRLGDGNRVAVRDRFERTTAANVAAESRRNDHGPLRAGERAGEPLKRRRIRKRRRRRRTHAAGFVRVRRRQQLARQREIYRAARLGHRDGDRPVNDRIDVLPGSELVVPLRELPDEPALVETVLTPVDGHITRPDEPFLRRRRVACHQNYGHVAAPGVHEPANRVRGSDGDVNENAGGLAADAVVTLRHRDREILVRNDMELGQGFAARAHVGQCLDDRYVVRARVAEHVFDAPAVQGANEVPGGADLSFRIHMLVRRPYYRRRSAKRSS